MDRRDKQLRALFGQDWPLSPQARRGLDRGYEQIRQQCRGQEVPMKRRTRRPLRLLILAAVIAAMAIGAGAIALHTDFFRTAFGTGVADVTESTYVSEGGEVCAFPNQERVEVDETAAQEQLGEYIADAPAVTTAQVFGYTITVESYLVDENGIGVLTYTLENPEGLHDLDTSTSQVFYKGWDLNQPGSGIFGPSFELNSSHSLSYYTYMDTERSTDTKAYLTIYFAPFESELVPETIDVSISGYTVDEGAYFDPETSEDVGLERFDDMETFSLPVTELVPAKEYRDEETGFTASLSQLGMRIDAGEWIDSLNLPDGGWFTRKYMNDGQEIEEAVGPAWRDDGIELVFTDGERSTLKADGIHNVPVETLESAYGTVSWTGFNRLITQEVSSIELDVHLSYGYRDELDAHLSLTPAN